MSGGELSDKKIDHRYHKYESSPNQLNESSFSSKPFALPRPSLVAINIIISLASILMGLSETRQLHEKIIYVSSIGLENVTFLFCIVTVVRYLTVKKKLCNPGSIVYSNLWFIRIFARIP